MLASTKRSKVFDFASAEALVLGLELPTPAPCLRDNLLHLYDKRHKNHAALILYSLLV